MIFSPSKSSCCQNPPREPGSEQTRRGGGCVCWLPSANSGSCSCHSVTATCPGPGAAPRAPWPLASAWPPPSATLGVSSRAASQNQGPNCCVIRVGKLRQEVAKRRAQALPSRTLWGLGALGLGSCAGGVSQVQIELTRAHRSGKDKGWGGRGNADSLQHAWLAHPCINHVSCDLENSSWRTNHSAALF